jgi:hypothetical protein
VLIRAGLALAWSESGRGSQSLFAECIMATFQIKDDFGLVASITPAKGALTKYFKSLPDFVLHDLNLNKIQNLDLTDPAITKAQAGVSFSEPIKIGNPDIELTVGAQASTSLSIFVPDKPNAALFQPDLFGDNIPVPSNTRYVSFSFNAKVNGGASVSPGDLKFGFDAQSLATFSYYERFSSGTKVLPAVEGVISRFCIPADLDDISNMPEGSIATADSSGELKFSGSVNLIPFANPLATLESPLKVLPEKIQVSAGAAIKVGGDYKLDADYQFRIVRLAGNSFRFGLYRKRESQFDIAASASVSLTAKLGDNDLFVRLIKALSSDPDADLKSLEAAGLPEDQVKAIQSAIKGAVDRSLAISTGLELSSSLESDAAFLYEIDLGAIQPDGRAMLHKALEGDFTDLVQTDTQPPVGIRLVKSILTTEKVRQFGLKVNLLGIYNVFTLSKLLVEGTRAFDDNTGELVLTDKISADKITAITSNLKIKDTDKLREILSDHFLITAVYRAVEKVVSGPDLSGLQSLFLLEANASKSQMRDHLMISVALGLQNTTAALAMLPSVSDFGRTTVYAEAGYDNAAFRSIFFSGNQLLNPDVYISAGRAAIQSLVSDGEDDDFRLKLARDDAFFAELTKIGNVQSVDFRNACLNVGLKESQVSAVGVDFLNIHFLKEALAEAGAQLQVLDQFFQQHPGADPNGHDFLALKKDLIGKLKSVAGEATERFGGPWGFEAMACLGKASSKKWILTNHFITTLLQQPGAK